MQIYENPYNYKGNLPNGEFAFCGIKWIKTPDEDYTYHLKDFHNENEVNENGYKITH